jgi:predicted alpha/beta-fold hydrolase
VLGRVNPDLALFAWDDPLATAEAISKSIEVVYQIDLLQRSGFGGGE